MDLLKVARQKVDDCGTPIITLSISNDGEDSVFNGMSKGVLLQGAALGYTKKINIRACITRLPREITRQVSRFCRTQKVESEVKYLIEGYDSFGTNKMAEIEDMFHAKHIYINGVEVVFDGGTIFEKLSPNSTNEFRLSATIRECKKQALFGCVSITKDILGNTIEQGGIMSTNDLTFNYAIPANAPNANVYNQNKMLVSNDAGYNGLVSYFEGKQNVESASLMPLVDLNQIPSKPKAVVQVVTNDGRSPESYIYSGGTSDAQRIYPVVMSESGAFDEIANGVDLTICGAVTIATPIVTAISVCAAPTLGVVLVERHECAIEPIASWTKDIEANNKIYYKNRERRFLINIKSAFYGDNPSPILIDETVAVIMGDCLPQNDIVLTNTDNAQIPVGSTLTIRSNGEVKWYGYGTYSDTDYSKIQLINIIF